jgi:hypothetical protein
MNTFRYRAIVGTLVSMLAIGAACSEPNLGDRGATRRQLDPRTPYRTVPPPELPVLARETGQAPRLPSNPTRSRPLASGYSTFDYVIKSLEFDETNAAGRRGFNPDGRQSSTIDNGGCNIADHASVMSTSLNQFECSAGSQFCVGSVDNYLPELADAFDNSVGLPFRQHANEWIAQGRSYWLLRITYVDNTANDDYVEAWFYRGFARVHNCQQQLSGAGEFNVDNAYLLTAGNINTPAYPFLGSIVDGKLYLTRHFGWGANATISPVPIVFGVSSTTNISFNLFQPQFMLEASQLGSSSLSGMAGGWANTDALSYSIELAFPQHSWQVFNLMPKLSDLANPSTGACDTGTPLAVGGLSMGAGVTLVPAILKGTSWSPDPLACGGW